MSWNWRFPFSWKFDASWVISVNCYIFGNVIDFLEMLSKSFIGRVPMCLWDSLRTSWGWSVINLFSRRWVFQKRTLCLQPGWLLVTILIILIWGKVVLRPEGRLWFFIIVSPFMILIVDFFSIPANRALAKLFSIPSIIPTIGIFASYLAFLLPSRTVTILVLVWDLLILLV